MAERGRKLRLRVTAFSCFCVAAALMVVGKMGAVDNTGIDGVVVRIFDVIKVLVITALLWIATKESIEVVNVEDTAEARNEEPTDG